MFLLTVFLIAVGLAMDAFAVSLATGCTLGEKVRAGHVLRMAGTFGGFQALMPFVGWLGGIRLADILGPFDHWVAFVLLAFIGVKMVVEGVRHDDCDVPSKKDPTRGLVLVMLGVATSIDALAVGLSFGVTRAAIVVPCVIIGLVCAAFSGFGLVFGRKLGCRFGSRMEIVGGVVLVAIGVKIAVEHLMKQI
jgi:putative Mn2+ efflux pump MntP